MQRLSYALVVALLIALAIPASPVRAQDYNPAAERRPQKTGVPVYPKKARDRRIEGEVVVCYVIDENGRVRSPFVESSSHRIFNKSALRAIRATRYEPAAPGATNARTSTCNTYRFVLTPKERDAIR